jgi:predicted ArsR family transcriptional regulator
VIEPVTLQQEAKALGDPTRHAIFRYVAGAPAPVDIPELTGLLGLNHNAIRQHLAKLVAAGLVEESKAASSGRGRPRLLYTVAPGVESRWGVVGPYERLALLLTEVIRTGKQPYEVGTEAGRRARAGLHPTDDGVDGVAIAMRRQGFEPIVRRRGRFAKVTLENCPFASAVQTDRQTICELHRGMADGITEGSGAVVTGFVPKDPRKAGCLVVLDSGDRDRDQT